MAGGLDIDAATLKSLKIKTGVVKRMKKEVLTYEKEEQSQRKAVSDMKAGGAEAYDVKKKQELLDETLTVLPVSRRRLEEGMADLQEVLGELPNGGVVAEDAAPEAKESAEVVALTDAHKELAEAGEVLNKADGF